MYRKLALLLTPILAFAILAYTQTKSAAAPQDSQALDVLTKCLAATFPNGTANFKDLTAIGSITRNEAGEDITGQVTIRQQGNQVRVDMTGTASDRSWAVSDTGGQARNSKGDVTPLPVHALDGLRGLLTPALKGQAKIGKTDITITYVGLEQTGGQAFHHLQIAPAQGTPEEKDAHLKQLGTTDLFIDANTYLLAGVQDSSASATSMEIQVPHALYLSDYKLVNGVNLPTTVTERLNDQRTWQIRLTTIELNTNLTASDFQL